MSHHDHAGPGQKVERNFLTSRVGIGLVVLLAIGGFLLFTEHRAHVLGSGLFLLLLACPLLHLFMHSGHSAHGDNKGSSPQQERDRSDT
jgi:hypothetical protein